jgi:hypothetical protein
MSGWVIGAAGMALVSAGLVRAAEVPGFEFKSLLTIDSPLGDTDAVPHQW